MKRKKSADRSGLTKADLIDAVYERHGGLTKNEATEIVDAIFQTVKTTLGDGRPVRIKNFGSFEVRERPGRYGVNPSSGERIFIPAHNGLNFRPARRLRSSVAKLAGAPKADAGSPAPGDPKGSRKGEHRSRDAGSPRGGENRR